MTAHVPPRGVAPSRRARAAVAAGRRHHMVGLAEAVGARERLMRRALTVQLCVSCVDAALMSARAAWCVPRGNILCSPFALPRRPKEEAERLTDDKKFTKIPRERRAAR